MASEYITQCPECHTRFNVTLEQLNKAQGLVRCGSCMAVFSADQHLTTEAEPEEIQLDDTRKRANPNIPEIPLQIRHVDAKKNRLGGIIWGFLGLLGLLGLLLQVLWFERAQLSQHSQLASLYGEACKHIDCRLSARQDLPQITSHQLVVRDHPKYLGALSVDILMENQAPFAQPFPAIQLVFTDLNGEAKAARSIQPQEYLGGDFSDSKLMPPHKPVQVQIELIDPGNQAPNYRVQFVPPRQSS